MNSSATNPVGSKLLKIIIAFTFTVVIVVMQLRPAQAELIHRYRFQDDAANDSVGKLNGKLNGDAKVADGKLVLNNLGKKSDDAKLSYVSFADRLLPKNGSATVEVWFTSKCDGQFARVVDFGQRGQGYLFFTVDEGNDTARAAITNNDWMEETTTRSDAPVNDNKPHMVALVIDDAAKRFRLYIDGKQRGDSEPLGENTLDKVKGSNHWLGRSLYDSDVGFTGSIDELRIYDSALSAEEIAQHFNAGAATIDEAKK